MTNISRPDVVSFYQNYVRPQSIILGIVGDFDSAQMIKRVQSAFDDWQVDTSLPALEAPAATQEVDRGIFVVDRPKATQSNILMGHIGGLFSSPDYPALSVFKWRFKWFWRTLV